MRPWLAWLTLLVALNASAEERVLRIATLIPDGTAWAREVQAFAREVNAQTHGAVRIKWYFGGIAGDEIEMASRMERGQLDGAASAGALCQRYAPSLRMMVLHGLFQTRGEAHFVLARLHERIDDEFSRAGFVNLGEAPLGAGMLFSREPIRSYDQLRHTRMWFWADDSIGVLMGKQVGFQIEPGPIGGAGEAYDQRRVNGFFLIPQAALAWQLSSRVRYLTALRINFVTGCLVLSQRSFQRLGYAEQQAVRTAAAKLVTRLADVNQRQDDALLHGAFAHQGLTVIEPDARFRTEYYTAMREARDALGEKLLPKPLLEEVLTMLADYRAAARPSD